MIEELLNSILAEDDKRPTKDIKAWGNYNLFRRISYMSSVEKGCTKLTKAMETGSGVVIQVTTEFRNKEGLVTSCSEALTFVPNCKIVEDDDGLLYIRAV